MTFIEQWQNQLADSLFQFAQLEPEAGGIGFSTGLLTALTDYFNAPALFTKQPAQAA